MIVLPHPERGCVPICRLLTCRLPPSISCCPATCFCKVGRLLDTHRRWWVDRLLDTRRRRCQADRLLDTCRRRCQADRLLATCRRRCRVGRLLATCRRRFLISRLNRLRRGHHRPFRVGRLRRRPPCRMQQRASILIVFGVAVGGRELCRRRRSWTRACSCSRWEARPFRCCSLRAAISSEKLELPDAAPCICPPRPLVEGQPKELATLTPGIATCRPASASKCRTTL